MCHSPTGCSKWNPIEHRVCSQSSLKGAGKPLRTWDTLLGCIGETTTTTGLTVAASLLEGVAVPGQRVSDAEMKALLLDRHDVCPAWNDTLRPRSDAPPDQPAQPANRDVGS